MMMSDYFDALYLDPDSDIDIRLRGLLPHWNQHEKMQFITFRLGDSLPHDRISEIRRLRSEFERCNPRPWSPAVLNRYHRLVSAAEERLLDNGYGACLFGRADCRRFLSEAIRYYDNNLYRIEAYVIMPNHVHLLLIPAHGLAIADIVKRIKSYSARRINNLAGIEGPLWMREYYDRLIRNRDHYRNVIRYIIANPRHLPSDRYELYIAD